MALCVNHYSQRLVTDMAVFTIYAFFLPAGSKSFQQDSPGKMKGAIIMGNLVRFRLSAPLPPLTEEEKEELRKAKEMPFVYDEDCPPQTEEELRQFRRVYPGERTANITSAI